MLPSRSSQRRLSTLAANAVLLVAIAAGATRASAAWSLNVGYQNPAVSTIGLNFLYMGSSVGFEIGIGWVDLNSSKVDDDEHDDDGENNDGEDDDKHRANLSLAGDADLKYFFSSGGLRPFIQAGVGIGASLASDNGFDAGAGGGFAGIGLLGGSPNFYIYVSGNAGSNLDPFLQAGVGFGL